MFIFSQKLVYRLVFIITISMFSASVISQVLMSKTPCQLCLITRYLFLTTAIVTATTSRFKLALPIVATIALSFSFYHLGVENHWWQGPHGCISKLPTLDSIKAIDQLDGNTPYCDRVNWTIFGISSTLWSFAIDAFIFWITSTSYIVNYYLGKVEKHDNR